MLAIFASAWAVFALPGDDAALSRARERLAKLSLADKVALCAGSSAGEYPAMPEAGISNAWRFCGFPFAASGAAALPTMPALAETWNVALAEAAGEAIGAQARALGVDMVLAPRLGVGGNPLAASSFLGLGEDPLLAARLAVPLVKAMQRGGVAACVGRFETALPQGERARNELLYRQFRSVLKDGGALGVLTGRGVDAAYAKGLLRARWGFDGMILAEGDGAGIAADDVLEGRASASKVDETALRALYTMERVKHLSPQERANGALSADAGADAALKIAEEAITLLKNDGGALPLKADAMRSILVVGDLAWTETAFGGDAGRAGTASEGTALRGLEERFSGKGVAIEKMPLAGHPGIFSNAVWQTEWFDNVKEPQEMAVKTEEAARPGFAFGSKVPLDGMNASVFCVRWTARFTARETGEHAMRCRFDANAGAAVLIDGREIGRSSGGGSLECRATLNEGEAYEISVIYTGGEGEHRMRCSWLLPSEVARFEKLRAAIEKADAVLVFTGTKAGAGAAMEGAGADRPDLRLPPGHNAAIEEVLSWKSPKVVVVCRSAGPVEMPWADECPALLHLPYLGHEAGRALANVLFGDVAPSGKLAFTWPIRLELSPAASPGDDAEERRLRAEGLYDGYRWYDKKSVSPLFPFGHGLSYTRFLYDMDNAEVAKFGDGDSWSISLPVKNIGAFAGKETVQIYAAYPNARQERPVKELKAFAKTRLLQPGEQETLALKVKPSDFAYWDDFLCRFRLDAGEYVLIVAASAGDIRGKAKITVSKDYIFEE